jgi:hypothetical protein
VLALLEVARRQGVRDLGSSTFCLNFAAMSQDFRNEALFSCAQWVVLVQL